MQTFINILKTLPKSEFLFELSQPGGLDLNDVLLYIKGCASSAEPEDILVLSITATLAHKAEYTDIKDCIKRAVFNIYRDQLSNQNKRIPDSVLI